MRKALRQLTVHTDADTTFEINGTNYTGARVEALSAAGSPRTAAFGTLTTTRSSTRTVRAGTSIPAPASTRSLAGARRAATCQGARRHGQSQRDGRDSRAARCW
jgi:hypothetical protein